MNVRLIEGMIEELETKYDMPNSSSAWSLFRDLKEIKMIVEQKMCVLQAQYKDLSLE